MASNDESGSDLLVCPVCSLKYKTPKFISCGHSICMEPCLKNLLQSSSPNCPVCSSEIQSTSAGSADSFPTNLTLETLLKRWESDLQASPSTSHVNKPVKRKLCQLHEGSLDKFCETCSELICERCASEIHDQLHEITSVTEATKYYFDRLENIEKELKTAKERIDKVSDILEKAKVKCQTDSDLIKTEINKAGAWVAQLVRNCIVDLSSKLDEKKAKIAKEIQNTESQNLEMLLSSNYLKHVCESLKNDHQGFSVTSKCLVDILSIKTEKMLKGILQLEKTNVPDGIGLCFRAATSNKLQENILGALESNASKKESLLETCNMWTFMDIKDRHTVTFHENYRGFAWVKGLYDGRNVSIIKRLDMPWQSIEQREKCLFITADISIISPNTDIRGLSVLGHTGTTVYKISFDPSGKEPSIVTRNLECAKENEISAVCWDENRTDCFALFKDGITIARVNFSGLVRRNFEVKLEGPVESVTSRHLHVSELGRMAICETKRKRVRYYDSVQAEATKMVTAPPDIKGWYPVFVVTRKYDQRWFVAWETLSYDIEEEGVPYARIYQYSESFDLEGLRFKKACHKIRAFSFEENDCDSDEIWTSNLQVAIEKMAYKSTDRIVSVYRICPE